MKDPEYEFVKLLKEKNLKVTTAESCTGGLTASTIVNVPGASDCIEAGYVTYSERIKREVLGVRQETLDQYTVVSHQTAQEMAKGALIRSGADIALSTTGIAGPDGGTKENPIGTVFIGCTFRDRIISRKYIFKGSRYEVRKQAADAAICMGIEMIRQYDE